MGRPRSSSARAATWPGSATSRGWTVVRPSEAWASARRSAAVSGLRQQARTRQPAAPYWRANSSPRPRLAPVTRTVGMGTSGRAPPPNEVTPVYPKGGRNAKNNRMGTAPAIGSEGGSVVAATRMWSGNPPRNASVGGRPVNAGRPVMRAVRCP